MDSHIIVSMSDWAGDLQLTVERVHRHPGRRYAPRDRLATFQARPGVDVREEVALLWLSECLIAWTNQGCPTTAARGPGAPQRGATGGETPRRAYVTRPDMRPTIKASPTPPIQESGDAVVSDGLTPPGTQPGLF